MKSLCFLLSLCFLYQVYGDVVCQDRQSQCPDGMTCCLLSSGSYGCCPMPNAVCCSDHLHCCPHGTRCDTTHGQCLNPLTGQRTPWHSKQPAGAATDDADDAESTETSNSVLCPDGLSQCPERTTCCKLRSGSYGCCPMPSATCCTDRVHCCPQGTKCNLTAQSCVRRDGTHVPLSRKRPATPRSTPVPPPGRQCPDGRSQCADTATCCKLSSGQYGCCPMPSAVCCSDMIHCCPHGTQCDVEEGRCLSENSETVPWVEKESASVIQPEPSTEVTECPTGNRTCLHGNTCCRTRTRGVWGCCPYNNGVCCRDREHCCPFGTRCDMEGRGCKSGEFSMEWAETSESQEDHPRMNCYDGSTCPSSATCCPHVNGHHYSCCPIRNAVCCGDHCCPQGFQCGFEEQSCIRDITKPIQEEEEDDDASVEAP